jgi:hypothetical protein
VGTAWEESSLRGFAEAPRARDASTAESVTLSRCWRARLRAARKVIQSPLSTPVETLTVPPGEDLTGRRGDAALLGGLTVTARPAPQRPHVVIAT